MTWRAMSGNGLLTLGTIIIRGHLRTTVYGKKRQVENVADFMLSAAARGSVRHGIVVPLVGTKTNLADAVTISVFAVPEFRYDPLPKKFIRPQGIKKIPPVHRMHITIPPVDRILADKDILYKNFFFGKKLQPLKISVRNICG